MEDKLIYRFCPVCRSMTEKEAEKKCWGDSEFGGECPMTRYEEWNKSMDAQEKINKANGYAILKSKTISTEFSDSSEEGAK